MGKKYFEVGKTYYCALWGEVLCVEINSEKHEYPIFCKTIMGMKDYTRNSKRTDY